MEREFIYYMSSLERAVQAVSELDDESKDLVVGLGIFLLVRDSGDADWYVFANTENPKPQDVARIAGMMASRGDKSDYSFDQLRNHAHLGFIGSGTLDQIMLSLSALANKSRQKIRAEIKRAKAQMN